MASIPHGTAILAQGTGKTIAGPPHIGENNIIPFPVGTPPPPNSEFDAAEAFFTELNLATPTPFRHVAPGVTEELIRDPNSLLRKGIEGKRIKTTAVL
jgi:hypothetical protein